MVSNVLFLFLPARICFWAPLKWSEVTRSYLTLCDPMDGSLPGSTIHGIFQARILEWAAISFSRGSSQPRGWTRVSCIADRRFTIWATREASSVILISVIILFSSNISALYLVPFITSLTLLIFSCCSCVIILISFLSMFPLILWTYLKQLI